METEKQSSEGKKVMIQEKEISKRQLRRMVFIETFGTGALSVPALACYKGQSGYCALFFYIIFLVAAAVLFQSCSICADEFSQTIKVVYLIRFFINAAALFYFFGKTVQSVYMPESSLLFILLPAAVLLWYSLHTVLQKRARFLELIFPYIIILYILAVILSFSGIKNAMQFGNVSGIWKGILSDDIFQNIENGYFLLLCSSPIEFLLFFKSALYTDSVDSAISTSSTITEEERLKKRMAGSLCIAISGSILCNIIFTVLSVHTLGHTLTEHSAWPVIKMMQLIRMPGGFLERFDILPVVFWLLGMTAVLSGYLYYGRELLESIIKRRQISVLYTGAVIVLLLLLACFVESHTFLWNFYLKYKAFVDFPLALFVPVTAGLFRAKKKKKSLNKREVLQLKKGIKCILVLFISFPVLFSVTGCQRLTDIEEKAYILSMYVDYPSKEEEGYEFWLAHADLSKMEERDDEFPCQLTKIKAGNMEELEKKYLEIIPGETEWNHIYTIFLGPGMAADRKACTRFLTEWDNAWQKSPNVLLALCPEEPKSLYKIKNIPDGAAGQEVSLLAQQNKKMTGKSICETPIDYLRSIEQKKDKIPLYRIKIEGGKLVIGQGVI